MCVIAMHSSEMGQVWQERSNAFSHCNMLALRMALSQSRWKVHKFQACLIEAVVSIESNTRKLEENAHRVHAACNLELSIAA